MSPFQARVEQSGCRGRPYFLIPREQLVSLRELGFSWSKIAQLVGVSRRTIFNRRVQLNIDDPREYSTLTDAGLDREVMSIKTSMPNIGVRLLHGSLLSRGIIVQQHRVRSSLHRVDPINTALRWASPISRRVYSVPCANSLWHIDGNHKLIRYG